MRSMLMALFAAILLLMLAATIWASMDRSVFAAGNLFADRWFVATFCDAYCGFITFYVWVAYRESSWTGRIVWFVAIMALGNMGMAAYMLWRLWRWAPGDPWKKLLLNAAANGSNCQSGEAQP